MISRSGLLSLLLPFGLLAAASAETKLPTLNYLVSVSSTSLTEAMSLANCYAYNDPCTPIAARIGIVPKTRTFTVGLGFDLDWPHLKHEILKCEIAGLEGKLKVWDVENDKYVDLFTAEDFRRRYLTEYRAPEWIAAAPALKASEIDTLKAAMIPVLKGGDQIAGLDLIDSTRQRLGIPRSGHSALPDMTGYYDEDAMGTTSSASRIITFSWPAIGGDPCKFGLTLHHEYEHAFQNTKVDACAKAGKKSLFDQHGVKELFAYLNGPTFLRSWCPAEARGYENASARIIVESRFFSIPDKDFKSAGAPKPTAK